MKRREFLANLSAFLAAMVMPFRAFAKPRHGKDSISSFAFGSCLYQFRPQPLWKAVDQSQAELFVFLGDNIYADTENMAKMKHDYELLGAQPGYQMIRKKIPVLATWDDHDFGRNDGGADYPKKAEAKELMMDFFHEPKGSPRRSRNGVYTSYFYGAAPNRLQVILLDLRWFKSPNKDAGEGKEWHYVANTDPDATLLGSEQWAWLEDQLRQPADLRILGSSVQLVSSEHGWEKWANFPAEKTRLYSMIDKMNIRNLLVLSGDVHFAELSQESTPSGTVIHDLTASAMNFAEKVEVPNSKRLFAKDNFAHFGLVKLDWSQPEVRVRLEIRDEQGHVTFGKRITFPRSV